MSEQPEPRGRVGTRVPRESREVPATPLSTVQLAERALATQNKPQGLVAALSEAQVATLAAALDEDGLAVKEIIEGDEIIQPGTARIVRDVLKAYYDENKAVVDALDD